MCTRYSWTKGQAAILALIKAMRDNAGNVPSDKKKRADATGLAGYIRSSSLNDFQISYSCISAGTEASILGI